MDRLLYNNQGGTGTPPINMTMSALNNSQNLLEKAQKFSQLAVQQVQQVRAQIDCADEEEIKALKELIASYDKLSAMKWDAVRKEYEASCRASLEDGIEDVLHEIMPACQIKTPGKEKSEMMSNNVSADTINPHDWIANVFRNGAVSSLEVTNGKHSFSLSDCFPGLERASSPMPPVGYGGLPPPGFGSQTSGNMSLYSSDKSEEKDTTQSTSTPSEISSLGSREGTCCGEEERDDSSIETFESDVQHLSEDDFDYVYKGGFAMKASNGKEIKGIVPKTVRHVLVHSSVNQIDEGAFQGCAELESVTIHSSVESLRDNAFRKCHKLKSVVFLSSRSNTVDMEPKFIEEKKTENLVESNRVHRRSTSQSSVRTSSQLRTIGEWTFFNCSSLESINLPHGLETIGTRAFQRCSVLKLETLPETLVSVGENAFSGCSRETRAVVEQWEINRV